MKKNVLVMVFIAFLILLGTANLAAGGNSDQKSSSTGPIKIGVVGALSGPSAVMGKGQQQGVEIAVKEINAAGGILGRQVVVNYRDDESDPTKSRNMIEELIDREKVNFMIGPVNSTPAAADIAYYTENKIINFFTIATSDAIIDPVKYPYAFRIMPQNGLQAEAMALIAKSGGYKRIVIIGDTSALGTDGLAQLEKQCKANGITPVAKLTYVANDPDMAPVAEGIANAKADYALLWTLGADGARLVRALERNGYVNNLEMLGYTGVSMVNFRELAGPAANKVCSITIRGWTVPSADGKLDRPFLDYYGKLIAAYGSYGPGKRDTNPTDSAGAYDAVNIIKFAVEKAGSLDPDAVKRVLETNMSEYKSFYSVEPYKFSPTDHNGFRPTGFVPFIIGEYDSTNHDLAVRK